MTESFPWYAPVTTVHIEQGDFLTGCPMFQVRADGTYSQDSADVVLLSHSCDLANDKLEIAQVCPYWPLTNLAVQVDYLQTRRGREDLRRGNLPGYHLLNCCTLAGLETDLLVLDFRSIFGIPIATARTLAQSQNPRRRLLPPYREHMAQAFARFFMRVGLPVDIPAF
jgi:hypothetical protein